MHEIAATGQWSDEQKGALYEYLLEVLGDEETLSKYQRVPDGAFFKACP